MTNAHTVVLLGGSGLGPWAWQRVTPILNAGRFRRAVFLDAVLPQPR
jgi:hypothetical protein